MMKKVLLFLVAGILAVATWDCSGGGSGDGIGVYTGGETDSDTGADDDTYTFAHTDDYVTCMAEDTYDEGEITCYVDSRLDGITPRGQLIDPAFVTNNNLVVSYSGPEDPNYVDLGFAKIAGTAAQDFDLAGPYSPAVDSRTYIAGNTLDFFNRARPNGSALEIGALEYGSDQNKCIPRFSAVSIMP